MKRITKYGALTGLLAAIYLVTLSLTGEYGGSFLKYGKYIFLILGLIMFYARDFDTWRPGKLSEYVQSATLISLITAAVIVVSNSLLFAINPEFSIQKYNLMPASISQLMLVNLAIIGEVVVLGLMCAFIIFPSYKNNLEEAF